MFSFLLLFTSTLKCVFLFYSNHTTSLICLWTNRHMLCVVRAYFTTEPKFSVLSNEFQFLYLVLQSIFIHEFFSWTCTIWIVLCTRLVFTLEHSFYANYREICIWKWSLPCKSVRVFQWIWGSCIIEKNKSIWENVLCVERCVGLPSFSTRSPVSNIMLSSIPSIEIINDKNRGINRVNNIC